MLSEACAVCFGATGNEHIGRAFTWGIAIMLGFTFVILGGFALAIYNIEKRRRLVDAEVSKA